MNNFTHPHGKKDNAMTKFNLKGGKALALAAFFLFFTLGAMAQPGTPSEAETMQVLASHYPDPSLPGSPYAKILWGWDIGVPSVDFENGLFPDYWNNDETYPWIVTSPDTLNYPGYSGYYCMMSGNGGVANSTSAIEATVQFVRAGSISFGAGCWGENGNFDVCRFYIDEELQFSIDVHEWDSYSFEVSEGTHTFKWSYTKDYSADPTGDFFLVDNVTFDGIAGNRASSNVYNVYRFPCSVGANPVVDSTMRIAEFVTDNYFIDTTWISLENGDYQYGVEILYAPSEQRYWSNCLTKTELASLNVTATANLSQGGTVSGGGTYTYGDSCTLTASANPNYYFIGWMQDSVFLSYDEAYSFVVTRNSNFVAYFEPVSYYYEIRVEPEGAGEAELTGSDEEGIHFDDTITLQATPNPGYSFVKWSAAGDGMRAIVELSQDPIYTFTIDENFLDSVFGDIDTLSQAGIVFIAEFQEGINGCLRPSQLRTTDITPDFATLKWTERGEAESWYVFYHPATTTAVFPYESVEVSQNTFTLTDLQPDTEYEAFVVSACGVNNGVPNSLLTSDTLRFTTLGPCPTPLHVEVTNTTGTTATVTWLDYSDTYNVQVGDADFIVYESFGNGIPSEWTNDNTYSWTVVDGHLQSGNAGVDSSTSSISVTATFTSDGIVEFDAECMGEGSHYDYGSFSIDGSTMFQAGENSIWNHYSFDVTAGEHTFTWSYTKDGSLSNTGDYFAIDNVMMRQGEITWSEPIPVAEAPYTISGLEPITYYSVRVQGVCDTLTEWCTPIPFKTTDAVLCTITVSVNPSNAGSASGDGEFIVGDTCTLNARPNPGYSFTNWTKNGEVVSTDATFSFLVSESASYVANFSLNSYTLTINYKYADGSPAASTHTESVNYNVDYSVASPTITGYTPDLAVVTGTMGTQNVTVDVTYSINSYLLTINYKYEDGTPAATTHTENVNYNVDYSVASPTITGYTPDLAVVTGTMGTQNVTVDVTYSINSYQITATANPSVGGTVTGGGTYNHFDEVTLTATANEGYTFTGWDDGVQDAQRTVTVTGPAEYVANFQLNSYQITATAYPSVGGTVTGGGTYNHFETCTLTATPNEYYNFTNWTKNGQVVSTNASYSFTVTDGGTYIANFTRVNHQITATANPAESGIVSGAGSYAHGSTCTLTATANTGYAFSSWTKNGTVVSSSPSYSFTVTEDAAYVANFTPIMYTITVSADPSIGGTAYGNGTYLYNENCTVSAISNAGYTFTNWTKNGTVVSTDATYTFPVTENANLVAHFTQDHYTVTVSVDPQEAGTASGGGSFTYGETCTLTATPNTGYAFVNWTKNGTVVSSNANYSFTVTSDGSYVAHFSIARYTLTVLAEPAEGGTVHGGGNYDYGQIATLRAFANNGYTFVNWTKDGVVVSSNAIYSVSVREDAVYVANFLADTFEIKANTDPDNSGDIEGIGMYNYGEICTLTVIPHDEYEFINWTLNGEVVSEEQSFSFVVTESRDYVAHLQHVEGVIEQGGITISLFPNPAKNKLTVEASEPVNMLEIYNINGALVYRQNDCSDKIEINVQSYAIGTYMIRLTTDSSVEIRRFVKE